MKRGRKPEVTIRKARPENGGPLGVLGATVG